MSESRSTELKMVWWGLGAVAFALGSLIFITVAAMGKADAAQVSASAVVEKQAAQNADIVWIKHSLERIENALDKK